MKRILKREYNLAGNTVYMESNTCQYLELLEYDSFHSCYLAKDTETGEETTVTPADLVGNWLV